MFVMSAYCVIQKGQELNIPLIEYYHSDASGYVIASAEIQFLKLPTK